MAKFHTIPTYVDAYTVASIGPRDDDGNLVSDANGNVIVQAQDGQSAGTIPFTVPETETAGFGVGDYVVVDKNSDVTFVAASDFGSQFVSAK